MSEKSDAFAGQVEGVLEQFERTLSGLDWVFRRDPKRMRDEAEKVFTVPALTLFKGPVRLLLDPNGYDIPGADGVMDLYLLPPYDPVATLYLEDGAWFLHSPFPDHPDTMAAPDRWTRSPLTAEAIRDVLESIAEDAVPSV